MNQQIYCSKLKHFVSFSNFIGKITETPDGRCNNAFIICTLHEMITSYSLMNSIV